MKKEKRKEFSKKINEKILRNCDISIRTLETIEEMKDCNNFSAAVLPFLKQKK